MTQAAVHGVAGEALRAVGLTKRFGHVEALIDVDVELPRGQVLAVVGDNGAGKSTLAKILTGVETPDSGTLTLRGAEVTFSTPARARAAGIAAVFQDLAVVECLDVATNIFLGDPPTGRFLVDRKRMDQEAMELLGRLNVPIRSPRTPVGMLPGGQRQAVALARVLRTNADVIVLDEPTAALGIREKANLVEIFRGLRDQGKAVLMISHDLQVVFGLADRIQVLRLGQSVGVRATSDTDREEIIGLITGAVQ
jgi:ABC-type sugar transport system ATPase subunit